MTKTFRGVGLASVLLAGAAALAVPAFAQQSGPIMIDGPVAQPVDGMVQPTGLPGGVQELPVRSTISPGNAAPMPQQPDGGFQVTPPSVEAGDPARRMNLTGAPGYLDEMTKDAQGRLTQMVAAPAAGGAPSLQPVNLSNGTLTDLETLQEMKRRTNVLREQVEQGKLAVELWGVLYNNEHAKAWREREDKEKEAKKAEDKAKDVEAAMSAIRGPGSLAQMTGGALGGNAVAVMPVVYEVSGGVARILVPGGGEVEARNGTRLPTGHKVTRVAVTGVTVEKDGEIKTLGFGSSISSPAPAPVARR